MPPSDRDAGYLWDMLEAGRQAIELTDGLDREAYLGHVMARLAVERCVEILGEAAARVSAELRAEHPEIPWQKIVSQRNVLAHEYRDIRHDKLWRVLREDLADLLPRLEAILPPPPTT